MKTETTQENWSKTQAEIKAKWDKFSSDEIESFKGALEKIPAQIQKKYGIAKDQAESEYRSFRASLQTARRESAQAQSNAMVSEGGIGSPKNGAEL